MDDRLFAAVADFWLYVGPVRVLRVGLGFESGPTLGDQVAGEGLQVVDAVAFKERDPPTETCEILRQVDLPFEPLCLFVLLEDLCLLFTPSASSALNGRPA